MAQATITGNLGKQPELRHTQQGKPWTTLSIAWSERQKDRTGNWVDGPTVWVSVRVFGRQAENICDSLTKGQQVVCTGRLAPELWSSDRGEETVMTMNADVVAPSMVFQTAQVARAVQNNQAPQQPQQDPWNSAPTTGGFGGGQDDEPPF